MLQPSSAITKLKQKSISKLAFLYGLCGLLAFSVDQYLNWEFMIRQEQTVTALVIAVPVAGFLSAIAWPSIWISYNGRDIPSTFFHFDIYSARYSALVPALTGRVRAMITKSFIFRKTIMHACKPCNF